MSDSSRENILVLRPEKQEISEERMEEILRKLDVLVDAHQMEERVAVILERLSKSGRYAHIKYDPHAEVYVLIKTDGTRATHSPAQIDRLFKPPATRPQRSTLRLVR